MYPQLAVTPVYWLVQGTLFTGIFVVGHDAGHGSFSNSELVNSICGNICHTFLLCPYYMWKVREPHHFLVILLLLLLLIHTILLLCPYYMWKVREPHGFLVILLLLLLLIHTIIAVSVLHVEDRRATNLSVVVLSLLLPCPYYTWSTVAWWSCHCCCFVRTICCCCIRTTLEGWRATSLCGGLVTIFAVSVLHWKVGDPRRSVVVLSLFLLYPYYIGR